MPSRPARPFRPLPSRAPAVPLDWGAVQVFLAVAQAGSLAGAARTLGVTHSTVLRRISALEAAARADLFDRSAAGYALSAAGRDLLAQLGDVGERIERAGQRSRGADDAIRGRVRVTTTDTLVRGLLLPHLERFGALHPAVQLQLIVGNQFLSLARREADVAIRGSNRPPENLVGRHVGDIRTAPYASRAYLATRPRGTPLHELDWIAPDESLAHLVQAAWLRRQVAPARIVASVDSLVGMADAAAHGLGAAMLLCPLGDARPELVRLAEPDAAMDTQVWILAHPQLRQVARVRAFSQFMFDALSADSALVHR